MHERLRWTWIYRSVRREQGHVWSYLEEYDEMYTVAKAVYRSCHEAQAEGSPR